MSERKGLFQYAYRRSPDQDAREPVHHPVAVIGAGPVGLTAALDLAFRGVGVVLLDESDRIGDGSRGICHSKRSLEIWDRLGLGERLVAMGVTWKVGKIFRGNKLAYAFDLLPEEGHKMPAFINLQQYALEKVLVDGVEESERVDLRWRNRVTAIEQRKDCVRLTVETPEGPYFLDAEWVIAADGARSTLRQLLGLTFSGVSFDEKFLIADVRIAADFPTERRFWFDPPFHSGQSALMHRQPENIWRIDLQLGPEADVERELQADRVKARLRRMLGENPFTLEWVSIYRFNCRRLDRFVHGRVIFAGDAAHQVSPFGARGGNSGVQDAENIAWKLAAVLDGSAGAELLESYDRERGQAVDENISCSTASTDFIAPRSAAERDFRDAVLDLAPHAPFAQRMVNSGRLSVATVYNSPLSSPDEDAFRGAARLGAPLPDAAVCDPAGKPGYLLEQLGTGFALLHVAEEGAAEFGPVPEAVDLKTIGRDLFDPTGMLTQRLDASPGGVFLVRPDQHLCARWRRYDPQKVQAALKRALGH